MYVLDYQRKSAVALLTFRDQHILTTHLQASQRRLRKMANEKATTRFYMKLHKLTEMNYLNEMHFIQTVISLTLRHSNTEDL